MGPVIFEWLKFKSLYLKLKMYLIKTDIQQNNYEITEIWVEVLCHFNNIIENDTKQCSLIAGINMFASILVHEMYRGKPNSNSIKVRD